MLVISLVIAEEKILPKLRLIASLTGIIVVTSGIVVVARAVFWCRSNKMNERDVCGN